MSEPGIDDARLATVPTSAGVYLFRDRAGEVIYVGKAKDLRARVRQYFRGGDERLFVAEGYLARAAASLETIVVTDEKEALLLENHLIKQHQPKFNVKLRDDKQYLVLRLRPAATHGETPAARFPRVEVVRNIADDDARYFGPYHSATSARHTLRVLNRHFQLRTCTDHVLASRGRVCLQYQIKRCPGPCALPVEPAHYRDSVDDAMMFLSGRDAALIDRLRGRMQARAEAEDFEGAAALRDSIGAVERTVARQLVVQDDFVDQDVWGLHRVADVVDVVVLFVRGGKLVGRRAFRQREQELPSGAVLAEYVQTYYAAGTPIPDEVVVGHDLIDANAGEDPAGILAEWLTGLAGRKVRVLEPRRGVRARLVELAEKNAVAAANERATGASDRVEAVAKLAARLGLPRVPKRIECFDIAHTQGTQTVASMVTFVDGEPDRKRYRKFKVKQAGNDDFASMYEVLTRRFARAAKGEPGWEPPDLVVIDGGKGQLGSATAAIADLGLEVGGQGMEIIGLAKERELARGDAPDRVFVRGAKDAMILRANSPELHVLSHIRDEAHRFANRFHRDRRGKAALTSALDDIPGLGPARKKALLRHFETVAAIAGATVEQLAKCPGMTQAVAQAVASALAKPAADPTVSHIDPPNGPTGRPES